MLRKFLARHKKNSWKGEINYFCKVDIEQTLQGKRENLMASGRKRDTESH